MPGMGTTASATAGALGRASLALALLKTYRSGLMLSADLADAQAQETMAQHGGRDPVASVLREIARSNRDTKVGLEDCSAAVDTNFWAQMHSAAMHVVGATAPYADGSAQMGEFARKLASSVADRSRANWGRLQDSVHSRERLGRKGSGTCAGVQLVQCWRTCFLYAKIACFRI